MDGRHDGARPWFKNEMGASLMGACREKAALLIVVADHGISGLGSPMVDLVVQSCCRMSRRHGRILSANEYILLFSLPFSRHFRALFRAGIPLVTAPTPY